MAERAAFRGVQLWRWLFTAVLLGLTVSFLLGRNSPGFVALVVGLAAGDLIFLIRCDRAFFAGRGWSWNLNHGIELVASQAMLAAIGGLAVTGVWVWIGHPAAASSALWFNGSLFLAGMLVLISWEVPQRPQSSRAKRRSTS